MALATVKEQVGEVLLGTTDTEPGEPQLSQLTRSAFLKHAKKDEAGDYFLDEESFIDAVAPESEDYVHAPSPSPVIRAFPS
jgi:solute carrier family 25 aspartate/glutamate transporter 12/13